MVGGVAERKFIQQGRRNVGGDVGDHADSRTHEVGSDSRERSAVAPQRDRVNRIPGIVNEMAEQAHIVVEVMVDANQFLAPVRGLRGRGLEVRICSASEVRLGKQRKNGLRVRDLSGPVVREIRLCLAIDRAIREAVVSTAPPAGQTSEKLPCCSCD